MIDIRDGQITLEVFVVCLARGLTFSQTVSNSWSGLALAMHLSSVTESPLVSVTDSSGGTTISGATSMPPPPPLRTSSRVYGDVSS